MENKESRKIGLTFLGFFYNLWQISKACWKKKKEINEQSRAESSLSRPN
jgi:hypothetical protein